MTPSSSRPRVALLDAPSAGVTIVHGGADIRLALEDTESSAVRRAADDLARDIRTVTGSAVSWSTRHEPASIVIGTVGVSAAVDDAVNAGSVDLSRMRDEHGALRWEAYQITIADGVLYLIGADRRGTIYAIYAFAEAIGVSPWQWWGNVPVRTRDHLTVRADTCVVDWPGVQYRGVFLNDEEELDAWARRHTPDGTIGPHTYRRVFELILRLGGNYLWPAMHVGAFNDDPENGRLAHEMGIVIGTSHCDMLLRSNEHEFTPWAGRQPEPVVYDYSVPGRNREALREYWKDSITQNRDYEVTWTVGMRGVHDTGFVTVAIDDDAALDEDEKFDARVALLDTVIRDQRELLSDTLGVPATAAPQLFIPYKEVLPLYDAGLHVPDDVTVVWANDNFGYIRRFPSDTERHRPGGHGLYYHSSYWSNMTTSYLATSSTPLALMKAELRKAWDRGIRKLWVDNIGGLKPLELEMEFFLRSAWEAGKEDRTADVHAFTADWVDATFGGGHGAEAADIYTSYYQLNNQRKLEHLATDVFPQTGYGDEAHARLDQLRDLYTRTNRILATLPADQHDAFFQLFAVKIHFAYLVNAQFVYADRSTLAHRQGKLTAADHYLQVSRQFDRHKRALIHFYNHVMSGGAWQGMFTPEQFPPPVMPLHPAATPALQISGHGLGVTAWGQAATEGHPALTFWPYGVTDKWIDVFSTGAGQIRFQIDSDPWIDVSHTSGTVRTEERIRVRVPDPVAATGREGRIRISSPDTGQVLTVPVTVASVPALPAGFAGTIEADGYVSLNPAHADVIIEGTSTRWAVAPYLGRYGNPAVVAQDTGGGDSGWSRAARLEHRFHLNTPGRHLLELHRLPTLDATGQLRVGVSVDDHAVITVSSPITDEHRGTWEQAVQDNIERLTVPLPFLDEGEHVLRLHVIDEDVTVSKAVIYTTTTQPTNLGPAFSFHTDRPHPVSQVADPQDGELDEVARVTAVHYRTDPAEVAHPAQVYAGPGFWDGDTTFRRNHTIPQSALGAPKYLPAPDGSKNVVAELGSGVIVEEDGRAAFEAEGVLAGSNHAWTTPGTDPVAAWTHTHAESDGGSGLAMHVAARGLQWENPHTAPGLHFTLDVTTAGRYHVWMLVKFNDRTDDACLLALDGIVQPASEQFSGGSMCTYGTRQLWVWALVSDLDISAGAHTFSVLAAKSGLRVDRIYLTIGDETPPIDASWAPSAHLDQPATAATTSDVVTAGAR